ncbi:MAG: tetratricopeptide repeat protein [Bacillati bacterium ANGP1]|uniref:Tetratricopeptide repeat protein n=1 Tax=Candidatus Segetimicrobium genomatis TaxID=2569760 RepID=A0A537KVD3_9BACT|nr:MAG: tetratricopeptide repeat protein [Terrabacteria group bacterium ANGP1]
MRSRRTRRRSAVAVRGAATLGQRIRAVRQSRGMTQRDLASGACSISFVSMVEHDLVRPSLATMRILAERLGRPLSQFFDEGPVPGPHLRMQHAEALLRQHRFAEALDAFIAVSTPRNAADHARRELGAGQALAGLRRFEEAQAHLRTAVARAAVSGDPEMIAAAANALGFLAFRKRRFSEAQEIFQGAFQRLRSSGLQHTEVYGKLLANLGRVFVELGLPAQALEYFREASETLVAAGDPFHLGLLYFNVGVAWERQQSFDRARESLQKAAELFAIHENVRLLGMVKRSLGMLHLERGELAAARADLETSLRLAGQSGDDEGTAQTLVELARLRARDGDAAGAQRAAEDAATLAARIHDEAEVARAKAALADALGAAGKWDDAAVRYQEAVVAFQALGMTGEVVRVCRDLGFLWMRLEKPEQAAHWFAQAFALQGPPTAWPAGHTP